MEITAIKAQKRQGRYNVFIDGQYRFPVSEEVLIKFRLHKNQKLTDDEIEMITNADQNAKAYRKALDYLSYQLRTEREIIDHLHQLDYDDDVISDVLKRLRKQKYLNDLEYAKSFVRTMARTSDKGPKVITQKLRQKGVLENDIISALDEFPFDEQINNAMQIATKCAKKYQRDAFKIRIQKIKKALFAKGFNNDIANAALEQLDFERDDNQEQQQLKVQGEKLMRRYQKLPLTQRNQKVKMALYRKGFALDDIGYFIDEFE